MSKHWKKFILPVLGILSLLSLYPIVNMFFWRDDYTLLYKIQQHESAVYPYQFVIPYFTPLYQWFGLNPQGYFVLGLLLYAVSAVCVFLFFRSITKTPVAFAASLLYASGLVALENMIQITYADVVPVFVILLTMSQLYLVQFIQKGKTRLLGLSIAFYILLLEFFPHRAHLVYVYILATDLLLLPYRSFRVRRILARQLPFLLLFLAWYLAPRGTNGGGANPQIVVQSISILKNHGINAIVNFTNLLLAPLDVLWPSLVSFSKPAKTIIGIAVAFLSLFLIRVSWRKYADLTRLHAYSFLLVIGGLVAYLLFNPDFVIAGISRYHTYTQLGFVLYIASGFFLLRALSAKPIMKASLTLLLGSYIFASSVATLVYTTTLNKNHSLPAKRFYQELKTFLPKLPADALLYIDKTSKLPYDASEFTRVGRLSTEAAFAAMYGVPMQQLRYTENFEDVATFASEHPENIETIYSFYLSDSRLLDTTKHVRAWLHNPAEPIDLTNTWRTKGPIQTVIATCNGKYTVGIPPTVTSPSLSLRNVTPVTIQLSLRITPLNVYQFTYPYYQSGITYEEETVAEPCKAVTQKPSVSPELFERLIALYTEHKSVVVPKVTTSSYFPPDIPDYAADGDIRTMWTADVTAWNRDKTASVTIDLPMEQEIQRILLTPGSMQRLPTALRVTVRQNDSQGWQEVKAVHGASMSEYEPYEITFSPTRAKQFQLTITKTNTALAPQIAELEFLSSTWNDIALADIIRYRINPYTSVPSTITMQQLHSAWHYVLPLRLYWKKDKDWDFRRNNYVPFAALADGALHTYTITIPAGGRTLEKLRLAGFIIPSQVSLGH